MNDRATKYIGEKYNFPVNLKSCWEIGEELLISVEYNKDGFECETTVRINKNN